MRPFHHNSNMGRGGESNGPLLTEHLRDLDLELELLKRKREMIEKQQSLLNQQQAFNLQSYDYDQPQSYRDQHYDDGAQYNSNRDYSSSSRDYSHMYNEPQQSRDRFPRQSAKKRLGDYVWSDPPVKRPFGGPPNKFAGPSNKFSSGPPNKFAAGPAKKFGPGPGPKQSKFVPPAERHAFAKTHPGKPKPSERFKAPPMPVKPKPTDFKPTKVVKPKNTFPNKTSAPKFVVDVTKSDQGLKPILQADQPPSQQMAGRLELALGNILKVIKDKYGRDPLYKLYFVENGTSRGMKQEIRERIRKVMLGKPVGYVPEIIKMYREVYPDSTDKDILEIGMQKKIDKKPPAEYKMQTDPTMNPYIFFKRNFSQLLSQTITKVFAKVEAVTKAEGLQNESLHNTSSTSDETKPPAEEEKTEPTESYNPEVPTEEKATEDAKNEDVTESKEENVSTEINSEADPNPNETKEDGADAETTNAETTEKSEESQGLENSPQNTKYPIAAVRAQYEKMINEMMPKKLAFWLPRLKGQIMKVLLADNDFKTAKKQIVAETEARFRNKEQNPDAGSASTPESKKAVADKRPKLKYYVKIQGRPMLPKKPLMKPFLDQFNPTVIKTIKSLRNLLFVGFENKADFDRIVAANGTVVGTDKIIVKISQWVTSEALNAPSEPPSTPNTSTTSEGDATMKEANESTELNTSLDNQIDELLTSIRNEEETENAEKQDGEEENADANENAEAEIGENEGAEEEGTEEQGAEEQGTEEQPNDEADNENGTEEAQSTENNEQETLEAEAKDKVEELKSDAKETGRSTPTRASNRLATSTPTTPSTIRTRRASRLAQN